MPATPDDIALATRPGGVTLATARDAAVLAAHPNARDGAEVPAPAFWDREADAEALAAARLDLLKVPRRRFFVEVSGLLTDLLPGAETPVVHLRDPEQAADGPFLVSRVAFDLDAGRTLLELWG